VGKGFDPTSFGNAAAAPADALAAIAARQIKANPVQEKANQADISSWYGLDKTDPKYKLSVLGRMATAQGRDAAAATGAAKNDTSLAQALASSIGGSANDSSGQVVAAGENAAGTANAVGEVANQYANDMNPLLAAEARSQQINEKGTNSKALQALQDSLATARGDATAARASAVGSVVDKNNALEQQHFANRGNVLSTLSQLAAADPNSQVLKDALTTARINETNTRTQTLVDAHNNPKAGPPVKGSFAASSTKDRTNFANAVIANISANGKPNAGMTRAQAAAVARRIAVAYFPHGGIPNGTGLIDGILHSLGL